jgi:arabinan endo-1,5-alpha-L-arabinosidase
VRENAAASVIGGRWRWAVAVLAASGMALAIMPGAEARSQPSSVYRNPLTAQVPGSDGVVESCADPSIISGHETGDPHWYVFCTMDPLNDADRDEDGGFVFRKMPILRSADLANWTYVGDVFDERPDWVGDTAGLWAPEIVYDGERYLLYYTANETSEELGGHSAIGVATAPTPAGPWTDSGGPAVEPRGDRWTFDPALVEHEGTRWLFFGSYNGGLFARELTDDGLRTVPETETRITIANRYEAPYVVERDGYWYLFVSATDCCRGPLTGYSVFVGRAEHPLGPYLDREGVSLLDGRVGGTPVLSMNGNRWVGPGHNAVFTDFAGDDWFLYHAVDRHDPYYADAPGFTKRPLMLDRLDWVEGWPTVRNGAWASDTPQRAPAAQPGDRGSRSTTPTPRPERPGQVIWAEEFDDADLAGWTWIRVPDTGVEVVDGGLRFETQDADLHEDSNSASVLTRPAPRGNYVVETRVRLDLPAEGCCQNFVQAGLVVHGDDDNYVKLAHVSIWDTRQTEFAKEVSPVPAGYPRYGNTVVGPPAEWTHLRITKRTQGGEEHYTAYTSRDGQNWVRGGTWTHELGADAKIGLVSMGGSGFEATFDHVTVSRLHRGG